MKGVIFTEFLELVETGFGMETADQVITRGCPSTLAVSLQSEPMTIAIWFRWSENSAR